MSDRAGARIRPSIGGISRWKGEQIMVGEMSRSERFVDNRRCYVCRGEMEPVAMIDRGNETYSLYPDGSIGRPAIGMPPSGQRRVTGAVRVNNFGAVVERFSLHEIIDRPETIPWKFKNGKQQTLIQDYDHGSHRVWANPGARVYRIRQASPR